MSFPTWDHLKEDGVPAALPPCAARSSVTTTSAITNVAIMPPASSAAPTFSPPRLLRMNSLADVQAALYEVVHAFAAHRVSHRCACRILFDLQRAAVPLRNPSPSPD